MILKSWSPCRAPQVLASVCTCHDDQYFLVTWLLLSRGTHCSCSQAATTNHRVLCYYKTTAASHGFDIFYPSLDLMKFKPNLNTPPALNSSSAQYPPGPKQRFYFWNWGVTIRSHMCKASSLPWATCPAHIKSSHLKMESVHLFT